MREPLNPTKATPAITVIKDTHLKREVWLVTPVEEKGEKTELV
jgi:hypothetical protein